MHATAHALEQTLRQVPEERVDRARLILQRRWLRDVQRVGDTATATCMGLVGVRVRVALDTLASRCACQEPSPCEHALALALHFAPPAPAPPRATAPPRVAAPAPRVPQAPTGAPSAVATPTDGAPADTLVVGLHAEEAGRLLLVGEHGRALPQAAVEALRWLWWKREHDGWLSGEATTLPQVAQLLAVRGIEMRGATLSHALDGAAARFHQRALGESIHVQLLDPASDGCLALAHALAQRGAHPMPGAMPADLWTLPNDAGFASWFLEAWARGADVRVDLTLNPKPLRDVDIDLDTGCLPARLRESHAAEPVEHEEIARFLARVLPEEPDVDTEHGHVFIPATRIVDVEEGLRALGANVHYKRLAPPHARFLQWQAHVAEDIHGARPRLREPFRGALSLEPPGLRAGTVLADYQREAVAFLLHHDHTCLLADEMGLGKTLEAIAAAQFVDGRILVVVPASAREVWRREVEKFTVEHVAVLGPGADPREMQGDEKYVVVGYSNLEKLGGALSAEAFDLVILDESHYVKNAASGRARLVRESLAAIPRRLVISGTPVMNTPDEVRAQLAFLHPTEWSDASWFKRRFADPFDGGSPEVREAVLARLRDFLEGVMLRREKHTALPDLPPRDVQWHRVHLPPEAHRAYVALESEFESYVTASGAASLGTAKATGKMERLKQSALGGKLPDAVRFVQTLLAKGDKVVVFSRYRNAIASVAEDLAASNPVVLTGETSPEGRADAENRFQNDETCRVFLGQLIAAGTALTLTAGTHVVFLDLDWNPANHRQAMDRIHRRGQTRPTTAHFFLAEGTIDDDVAHVLDAKGRMMDALLGTEAAQGPMRAAKRLVGERLLARRRA